VDAEIQYRCFKCLIGEVMLLKWTTALVHSDSLSFPSALSHWFNSTCDLFSCRSTHPPHERREGCYSRFSLTGISEGNRACLTKPVIGKLQHLIAKS